MTKIRRRENPEIRREKILRAAVRLAKRIGYQAVTRDDVADEADVSQGLVTYYFATIANLKSELIDTAIEKEIVAIVAQAVSVGDVQIKKLNPGLKQKVSEFFTT